MVQQWRMRGFALSARGQASEQERRRREAQPPTHAFDSSPTLRTSRVSPFAAAPAFPLSADIPSHDFGDERFTGASQGSSPVDSGRELPPSRHASVTHSGASFRLQGHPDTLGTATSSTLIRSASITNVPAAHAVTRVGFLSARSTAMTPPRGGVCGDTRVFTDGGVQDVLFSQERDRRVDRGGRRDRDAGRTEHGTATTRFASLNSSPERDMGSPPIAAAITISLPRVRRLHTQRRREQCRVNQARYRQRQNLRLQVLEELAACMREELHVLSALHSASLQQLDRVNVTTKTVYEYFNLFRNGLSGANINVPVFRATPPASIEDMILFSAGSMKDRKNDSLLRQAAYLRTIVAPDADISGVLRGPDAILEQWWRYSTFHKHVFFDVLHVESLPSHDDDGDYVRLMVTARICVVPNHHTLTHVFPDLQRASLSEKLMNQPLEFMVRMSLSFDSVGSGGSLQIVQMSTDVDLVSDLVRILGHLDDVEAMLRGACISPEGIIGSTVNHPSGNRLVDAMASF